MKKIAMVLVALLIAACSSTQKTDTSAVAKENSENQGVAATSSVATPAPEVTQDANGMAAELQELNKSSAYFDFDKYAVKVESNSAIQKQADFIMIHKNDVVTLEGNCDERGSEKYNMALGHRRASAVENALRAMGVPPEQIRTVSFGKDKPRLQCHEEKCWKENRRVDFVHKLN